VFAAKLKTDVQVLNGVKFCATALKLAAEVATASSTARYNAPTSHDRRAAIAYLRAESLQLSADYELLRCEFEALRDGPFDRTANAACQRKLRHLRALLANHTLAWTWTQYPPCGVSAPRPPCLCAILAPATDFPIIAVAADSE